MSNDITETPGWRKIEEEESGINGDNEEQDDDEDDEEDTSDEAYEKYYLQVQGKCRYLRQLDTEISQALQEEHQSASAPPPNKRAKVEQITVDTPFLVQGPDTDTDMDVPLNQPSK